MSEHGPRPRRQTPSVSRFPGTAGNAGVLVRARWPMTGRVRDCGGLQTNLLGASRGSSKRQRPDRLGTRGFSVVSARVGPAELALGARDSGRTGNHLLPRPFIRSADPR